MGEVIGEELELEDIHNRIRQELVENFMKRKELDAEKFELPIISKKGFP